MENHFEITPDKKTVCLDSNNKKKRNKHNVQNRKEKNHIGIKLYDDRLFEIVIRKVNITAKQILGSRAIQQDSFEISGGISQPAFENARAWAVICDGMGGMASGEKASQTTAEILRQILSSALPEDTVYDVLNQAIVIANNAVKAISASENATAGTTLVCVVAEGNNLYYASVGDSRIYICRDDKLMQITRDHNYMLELRQLVKSGDMTMDEAMQDPQKEALISFIGIDKLELVDVNTDAIELKDNDIILLCSDGLTKVFTDDEILAFINQHRNNIEEMTDEMLREVQIAKPAGLDNTTIAIMQYKESC